MNTFKIVLMLAALSGILLLVGAVVGSRIGLVMALMGGAGANGEQIVALIATAIVAPVAATLVQMAISRSREYYADEGAAPAVSAKPARTGLLSIIGLAQQFQGVFYLNRIFFRR